jgi:hypothetical protein
MFAYGGDVRRRARGGCVLNQNRAVKSSRGEYCITSICEVIEVMKNALVSIKLCSPFSLSRIRVWVRIWLLSSSVLSVHDTTSPRVEKKSLTIATQVLAEKCSLWG